MNKVDDSAKDIVLSLIIADGKPKADDVSSQMFANELTHQIVGIADHTKSGLCAVLDFYCVSADN